MRAEPRSAERPSSLTRAERTDELIESLVSLWEDSVRATHHFLTSEDVSALKPMVRGGLREVPTLLVAFAEGRRPTAFMGVDGKKVSSLFVAPQERGRGLGGRLMAFAVIELGANSVDVNEDNESAAAFYARLGFEVVSRSPLDDDGRPFPLLRLTLASRDRFRPARSAVPLG
jgi:putative acetyltransferase